MTTWDTDTQEATRVLEDIAVAVSGRHTWALEQLLRWGTRAHRSMLRMVQDGTDSGSAVDHHVKLVGCAG